MTKTCTVHLKGVQPNGIRSVILSDQAKKDLEKLPQRIRKKLIIWIDAVETYGLEKVRKIPGYHDEPLKGDRKGQHSIRLNKAYRAIYELKKEAIQFAEVQEVNKHDY